MGRTISAEIISTGNELMLGCLVDTNSAWLSNFLCDLGIPTIRHTAVGDDFERLVKAFKDSWTDSQLVIVTGGLGPTEDDLTRQAAAEAFGLELEYHETLAEELRALFKRRGYTITDNNLRQVWLPRSSILVPNPVGTAPGFSFVKDQSKMIVFLPGVSHEMKIMSDTWVKPKIRELFPDVDTLRHTVILKTAGLGESMVDSLVGDLMAPGLNPSIGLLAESSMVKIVVTTVGQNLEQAEALAAPTISELEKRLKGHIFGFGDDTLPAVVADLIKELDLKLIILDTVTQGRLNGSLSPSVGQTNWGGGQDLPWQPALSGAMEILRLYAPDSVTMSAATISDVDFALRRRSHARELRLIVTARPNGETPAQGQLGITLESAVQSEVINQGKALIRKFNLGGEHDLCLSRSASLSMFHLWQVLKGYIDA